MKIKIWRPGNITTLFILHYSTLEFYIAVNKISAFSIRSEMYL